MVTIPLHDYLTHVKDLIQTEQYERAIGMCQHALRAHPRCVQSYALLGQACLETDRPDDAGDMFRRVLGADPENFTARVGLGVVAEGIGALDEAIWQWERALELEPNHPEVRDELKKARASQKKNGDERIKLSRAALGRIYLRGEQYDKAASELRAALNSVGGNGEGAHDRFDLEVALAEALYRGGRMREAADVCRSVLNILPNALKPNLILGDIYIETGREDDARAMFEKAQSLDPENQLASQLLNQPAPLAPRTVTIESPNDDVLFAAPQIEARAQPSLQDVESALPWLAQTPVMPAPTTTPAPSAEPTSDYDLPDWLKALRSEALTTEPPTSAPAEAEASPSDLPDWLKALSETPAGETTETASPTADTTVAEPSILTEPITHEPSPTSTEPSVGTAAELSDSPMLLRAESEPSTLETTQAQSPTVSEVAPDWLAALRDKRVTADAEHIPPESAAAAESPVAESASDADLLPEWLRNLAPAEPEPPATFVQPPRIPREPLAYFDDSAAPPSIETQDIPQGDAEQQARLDLARALKDLDLDSAFELYAMMDGASEGLRQQAIADLQPLAASNARAQQIMAQLRGSALVVPPASAEAEAPRAPMSEAHPEVAAPPATPPQPEPPVVEPPRAPREATAYFDDSAAPPSIESQAAPTGEAEYAARLDLARTLADLDLDSALDQYALMGGANAMLRQQAIDDLNALTRTHAEQARVHVVLEQLQSARQRAPDELDQAQPEPAPPAPAEPVVTEEAMEQFVPMADETRTEVPAPTEPIVTEETMEPPREAIAYLDDSSAPPSVESQAVPTGAAQYQACLDLARAWKFMDVDEALKQYAHLRDAPAALRQQAIADVEQLAKRHPQAQRVLADLRAEPAVSEVAKADEPPLAEQAIRTQAEPTTEVAQSEAQPLDAETTAAISAAPTAISALTTAGTEARPTEAEQSATPQPMATAAAARIAPQPEVATPPSAPMTAEPTRAPREATAYFDDSAAPPSIETQTLPTGNAEFAARLDLARTLRDVDLHESAEQYKALMATPLLPQVIDDLSQMIQEQPSERGMRVLLADALTRAGRLPEAIEQYRALV